ncbi:hypothetical protein ACJX0J_039161, partial [Zea mays]
ILLLHLLNYLRTHKSLSTESQNKSTVTDPILMTVLAHTLPFVVFHVDVKGEKVRAILGGRFALFLQAHAAESNHHGAYILHLPIVLKVMLAICLLMCTLSYS